MSVEERMTRNVARCTPTADLQTVAGLLWLHDCGCIAVVDESNHVKGMITDRDICMAAMTTGKQLADLFVADCMSADVVSARAKDSLHEAELIMRNRGVRRLPVIDDQDHLIGILSCNDLLRGVDDGGTKGMLEQDAVHLVRTLAIVGHSRAVLAEVLVDLPEPGAEEPKVGIACANAKSVLAPVVRHQSQA